MLCIVVHNYSGLVILYDCMHVKLLVLGIFNECVNNVDMVISAISLCVCGCSAESLKQGALSYAFSDATFFLWLRMKKFKIIALSNFVGYVYYIAISDWPMY